MTRHYDDLTNMKDHISTLHKLRIQLQQTGNVIKDIDFAWILITSLPPDTWREFMSWYNSVKEPKSKDVILAMIGKYMLCKEASGEGEQANTLYSRERGKGSRGQGGGRGQGTEGSQGKD
ncbi:hypothetical protein CALCODRAFT_488043 [Calocera cornea HHB12733]|uniref:Uncharacterized protein n=1 Tax=Calocera cornea HHB12733 TaxID=1353952 RepID=A0A165CS21_9BASI|nr:hypothetical protein CALCODRAFT_488043 [Calocera cornea HHB12733]